MRTLDLDQFWPTSPSPASSDAGGSALARIEIPSAPAEQPPELPEAAAPDVPPPAAIARRRGLRGFDASAAVWASLGFMAGMAAWHAVGFWGFVHTAVLKGGPRDETAVLADARERTDTPRVVFKEIITTGALPTFTPKTAACVALVVDKDAHATAALPCAPDASPMRDAGRRRRADRLQGVEARLQKPESWAIDTQPADTADAASAAAPQAASAPPLSAAASVGAQTVAEREFDMTIHTE